MISLELCEISLFFREIKTTTAKNPTTPLNDAYHGGTSLFIWVYELRQLIFKAIQDIEISLLIKMIQVFSMEHGTFCSCVHIVAIAIK